MIAFRFNSALLFLIGFGFTSAALSQNFQSDASIVLSSGVSLVLTDMGISQSGSGEFLGTGTVILSGTAPVTFSNTGTNDLAFYHLEMANTGGLTLDDPIDVTNSLTLTDGIIDANTNDIHFGTLATVTGGSNSAHIDGFATKTGTADFSFPVGDNGIYQYMRITDIGSSSTFRVSYTDAQHPQAGAYYDGTANASITEEIGNCDHWDVEQVSGSGVANVIISYGNNSCNSILPGGENFLSMAVWDGLSWNYPVPGVDPTSILGEVASTTPFSDFGGFVLASNNPAFNVLPIDLITFNATAKTSSVFTEWITASEVNNDYFTVERSQDGHAFSSLKIIDGAGNSSEALSYSFIDESPLSGTSYYRLRQTDFDGASTISEPVAVELGKNQDGFSLVNAYRCSGNICIVYQTGLRRLQLSIFNSTGKLVHQSPVFPESNFQSVPLAVSQGMYHVSLSDGLRLESRKVFFD